MLQTQVVGHSCWGRLNGKPRGLEPPLRRRVGTETGGSEKNRLEGVGLTPGQESEGRVRTKVYVRQGSTGHKPGGLRGRVPEGGRGCRTEESRVQWSE